MELNYYVILDDIIKMMKDNPNSMSETAVKNEIDKPLASYPYNSERDFPTLWQQLKDDKIVMQVAINGNWRLSIKGLTHSYLQIEEDKALQRAHLKNDVNRVKRNEILTLTAAFLAAVGTLIIAYWETKKQYPLFPFWE